MHHRAAPAREGPAALARSTPRETMASRGSSTQRDQHHAPRSVSCTYCGIVFPSRTKLFKHLRGESQSASPGDLGGAATDTDCMVKARDAGMAVTKRTIRQLYCTVL